MKTTSLYLHRFALAVLFGIFLLTNNALADAHTADEISHFDLPGQALQASLIEFALQAGITVITDTEAVKAYWSSPVVGRHRADDALASLLSNTGLTFQYHPDTETFIIWKKGGEPILLEQSVAAERPALMPIEELLVSSVSYPFAITPSPIRSWATACSYLLVVGLVLFANFAGNTNHYSFQTAQGEQQDVKWKMEATSP